MWNWKAGPDGQSFWLSQSGLSYSWSVGQLSYETGLDKGPWSSRPAVGLEEALPPGNSEQQASAGQGGGAAPSGPHAAGPAVHSHEGVPAPEGLPQPRVWIGTVFTWRPGLRPARGVLSDDPNSWSAQGPAPSDGFQGSPNLGWQTLWCYFTEI